MNSSALNVYYLWYVTICRPQVGARLSSTVSQAGHTLFYLPRHGFAESDDMLAMMSTHTVSYTDLYPKGVDEMVRLPIEITSDDFAALIRFVYPKYVDISHANS